jgi:hypothetical protein
MGVRGHEVSDTYIKLYAVNILFAKADSYVARSSSYWSVVRSPTAMAALTNELSVNRNQPEPYTDRLAQYYYNLTTSIEVLPE